MEKSKRGGFQDNRREMMKMEKHLNRVILLKINLVLCFQWFGASFLHTKQSHMNLVIERSRTVVFEGLDWKKSDTIEVII